MQKSAILEKDKKDPESLYCVIHSMYHTVKKKDKQENVTHIYKEEVLNRNQLRDSLDVAETIMQKREREKSLLALSLLICI